MRDVEEQAAVKPALDPAAPRGEIETAPVLVVDLDGTLCRSDTLHETLIAILASRPLAAARLMGRLRQGKAAFKAAVGDLCILPPEALPLNETVLDLIRKAKAEGRRTALVSATDHRQVVAIAEALDLFDEAVGTGSPLTDGRNLSGPAKADFLVERYGRGGFDYIGDAAVDRPVWIAARRAITAGGDERLRRIAEDANAEFQHIDPAAEMPGRLRPRLRALRPHQWSKNLLVFAPLAAAQDFSEIGAVIAAFIAFSLTASSVYLINDLVDLPADRVHPRKRRRPFAAGEVPVLEGVLSAVGLILGALLIALVFAPVVLMGMLAAYYVATLAYSFLLKRKLVIDVLALAGLYTIRIITGAVVASLVLSPWLLGFSMFLFLALAAVKRQAELTDQLRQGKAKTAGRAYETDDLPILRSMALSAGYASVLVFALYINSDTVSKLYGQPELLWCVCPLLIYWISRIVMVTHRGHMTDDPIVFAATDRVSYVVAALCATIFVVAGVL
ncbi:MAG: UbiA family prenyltransferase [Pseudomonadota bacterium]